MINIVSHLRNASEIIKGAKTQIHLQKNAMDSGSAVVPGSQSDLDNRFEDFTVPESDHENTKGGGYIDGGADIFNFFGQGPRLTRVEAELIADLHYEDAFLLKDIINESYSVSTDHYPADINHDGSTNQEDGPGDAFRHAYATALMARDLDPEFADAFMTAHESFPENGKEKAFMDIHNNNRGLQIALENPHATDTELAELINEEIQRGEMVVIVDGKPVPSSYFYGEFGGTPTEDPQKDESGTTAQEAANEYAGGDVKGGEFGGTPTTLPEEASPQPQPQPQPKPQPPKDNGSSSHEQMEQEEQKSTAEQAAEEYGGNVEGGEFG